MGQVTPGWGTGLRWSYPPAMELGVLGPLRVVSESGEVLTPGAKERTILAFLVSRVGQVVTAEELIDGLWPDGPPRTAAKTLQSYVARLRAVLAGPGADGPIRTEGRGYRLVLDEDRIDAHRFVDLARRGRAVLAQGRPGEAAPTLAAALALWRGPAYAGFEDSVFGRSEARRLTELRRAVREDWFAARLASGEGAGVVADLEAHVAENPLREPAWALLVRANAARGDQAAALAAIGRARETLAEELGVDLGEDLQSLQSRVLAQDATLLVRSAPAALPAVLVPRGGPFVGRRDEVAELLRWWHSVPGDTGPRIVVAGPPGSGRWRLACEFAARVHDRGAVVDAGEGRAEEGRAGAPVLRVLDLRDRPSVDLPPPRPGERQVVVTAAADPLVADAVVRVGPFRGDEVHEVVAGYAPAGVDPVELARVVARIQAVTGGLVGQVQQEAVRWARGVVAGQVAVHAGHSVAADQMLEAERTALAAGVQRWQELGQGSGGDPSRCPWRGLGVYGELDAGWFVGRERLTAELVSRVGSGRALLLVGASGSGKSSLLRAGLLASLAAGALPGSAGWVRVVMRPGEHPMRQLTGAAMAGAADTGPDRVADLLFRAVSGDGGAERVLLVVDQLEECWTVCADPGEREAFLEAITDLATRDDVPVTLVAAVRADHAGAVAGHPDLARVMAGRSVFIGPMVEGELRRVVEVPAARAGLTLDTGLTDSLVEDTLREPGGLPLLSTALSDLWVAREGRRLTLAAYVGSGGVGAAIARLAERALAEVDDPEVVRVLLLRLAGPGEGDGVVRRRVSRSELAALPDPRIVACVDPLTEARLLTVSDGHVEVAHEALFRSWPRLREWLADDAVARDVQRRLTQSAGEWQDEGRDPSGLWSGARLSSAIDLLSSRPDHFTSLEAEFVEASAARVDAERAQAEQRARHAQQQNRRLRGLLAGLAVVVVVAVVAGLLAAASRGDAQAQGVTADAQRLAATAMTADYLAERMLTAVEAVRTEESPQTVGALLSVLDRSSAALYRFEARYRLLGLDAAPGGSLGYAVESSEDVVSVDLTTGATRVLRSEPNANNQYGRISPDGSRLAFAEASFSGAPPRIVVLNADTGEEVWSLPIDTTTFYEGGFDWTGSAGELAVATTTGLARYQVGSDEPVGIVRWEETPPAGALLARVDDTRMLLFPRGPAPSALIDHASGEVTALDTLGGDGAVSPDGRYAVSQPQDPGPVLLLDLDRPTDDGRAIPFDGSMSAAAFTPDGSHLALGSRTGDILVTDIESLTPGETLRGHNGIIMGLATSPDAQTVWSAGREGDLIAWDLGGQRRLQRIRDLPARAFLGQVSDDGSTTVTWQMGSPPQEPHTSTVVSTATNTVTMGPLPGGSTSSTTHGITPDGTTVLIALEHGPDPGDSALQLHDVPTRRLRAEVPLPWVASGISVTPDGRYAVVAGLRGIAVVDLTTATVVKQRDLPEIPRDQYPVEVSPDGEHVALGRPDEVLILDAETLAEVSSWPTDPYDSPLAIAWLNEGATLAHGGLQGRIAFRSIPEAEPIAQPREVSPGWTLDLATNTPGTRLASLGTDGEVILWDPVTQQVVGEPLVPPGELGWGWIWFGSDDDGEFVEVQYDTARAVRYPVSTDTLIARACAIAGREPTAAEWQSMHGDTLQRPTCGDAAADLLTLP